MYLEQLQDFLDKNPPNLAVDRTETYSTGRGEAIKIIASIEDQVKMFLLAMEKLPKILEDLNRLRKEADKGDAEVELRGGADRPGFMDDDDEEEEEEKPKPKKKTNSQKKDESPTSFDDDSFFEQEPEDKPPFTGEQLQLPAPDEQDEGDDDWLNERES